MHQLELFEDDLKPISTWLHVWSEAERAARIKNTPARPAVHRAGAKAAEAAREKQSADEAACQRIPRQPSLSCVDSSAGIPKECRDAKPHKEHSRVMHVQSQDSGQQESGLAPSSSTRRSGLPQSP